MKNNKPIGFLDRFFRFITRFFLLERGERENNLLFFWFGAICWMVWFVRNDWIFRGKLISLSDQLY
jgi:hypothetical protein